MTIEEIKKLVICDARKCTLCVEGLRCDTWIQLGDTFANAYLMGMRKAFEECAKEANRVCEINTDKFSRWKMDECYALAKECAE